MLHESSERGEGALFSVMLGFYRNGVSEINNIRRKAVVVRGARVGLQTGEERSGRETATV